MSRSNAWMQLRFALILTRRMFPSSCGSQTRAPRACLRKNNGAQCSNEEVIHSTSSAATVQSWRG